MFKRPILRVLVDMKTVSTDSLFEAHCTISEQRQFFALACHMTFKSQLKVKLEPVTDLLTMRVLSQESNIN